MAVPLPGGSLRPGSTISPIDVAAQREDLAPELVLAAPLTRDTLEIRLP